MNNLLILGAGGYGRTVLETAQMLTSFDRIAFLDDKAEQAIGCCASYAQQLPFFAYAYPAFGDNTLRLAWMERLAAAGFRLPTILHPRAWVSPSATVEQGAVVLANAVVSAGAVVRTGCIVNIGALLDHDSVLERGVHLAPGAVVKAGNTVAHGTKVESGTVVLRPGQ